jgi:hypothetical protein
MKKELHSREYLPYLSPNKKRLAKTQTNTNYLLDDLFYVASFLSDIFIEASEDLPFIDDYDEDEEIIVSEGVGLAPRVKATSKVKVIDGVCTIRPVE